MIIYALALIFLMFYRPQGLFGYVELTAYAPFNKLKFLGKSKEENDKEEGGQK